MTTEIEPQTISHFYLNIYNGRRRCRASLPIESLSMLKVSASIHEVIYVGRTTKCFLVHSQPEIKGKLVFFHRNKTLTFTFEFFISVVFI